MSDPDLDALAEAARNRGLKLVRSRVRTPGKRRFGKVGLTDASGQPVFGMDAKGPIGKPADAEEYLRKLNANDWGASLGEPEPARKTARKAPPEAANDPSPPPRRTQARPEKVAPKPKPPRPAKPPPKPIVREARPSDATPLTELIGSLGHAIDDRQVRKNIGAQAKLGEPPLVATLGDRVVGLCGVHRMIVPHRPTPVGRITILVVAEEVQGRGIGRMLVDAAEAWMRNQGCAIVEVTSNDRLTAAHSFYRHMGYERTSIRFAKELL